MWGLFWRLFAAHLFAQFPLLTQFASRSRGAKKLMLSHTLLVGITTTLVVVYLAVYRPLLFALIPLVALVQLGIDLLVWKARPAGGRAFLLAALGAEMLFAGAALLICAAFAWEVVYTGAVAFFRLSTAIIALWGVPQWAEVIKSAIENRKPALPALERFSNFAFIERTALYIGVSASSPYILAAGILIAVLVRLLLYLNEENVRWHLWEWLAVAVLAGVPRIAWGGIRVFGL